MHVDKACNHVNFSHGGRRIIRGSLTYQVNLVDDVKRIRGECEVREELQSKDSEIEVEYKNSSEKEGGKKSV